jgi:putative ABC transport system permease protein
MTRGELRENLLVAMDTLRARKVRSGLTILGIVIGITSVISVAAIIQGLNGMISTRVSKFGARTMFVMRIPAGSNPFQRLPEKVRLRKYLQFDDAKYLMEHCPGLSYATTFINRIDFLQRADSIRYGDAHVERFFLRGVEPDYLQALPLFSVAQGRFLTDFDLEHARPVVVIGNAIAESLFPRIDPIGKTVRLNGRPFEVIGVFEIDPGLFGTPGVDQFAAIPVTTFHKNYPEIKEIFMAVAAREGVPMSVAHDQVVEAMRRRRHVPYNKEDDFETADPNFFADLWNQLTGALVLLTGVISSIGLLVGGIGVMNIMLISVTERTKEIGIRKAIGARKADIRVQFLLEAVTLSGLGGVIGILLGAMIAFTIRTLLPSIPATLSVLWVSLGVAISVSVGLFFGYYPADRAANLDPIECLRYE